MIRSACLVAVLTGVVASTAHAGLVTDYRGNQAGFVSAIGAGMKSEDFESLGGAAPSFGLKFGGASDLATLSSIPDATGFVNIGELNGRHSVASDGSSAGQRYFETDAGVNSTFTITFLSAVNAFGFWGLDIGDFGEVGTRASGMDVTIEYTEAGSSTVKTLKPSTLTGGASEGSTNFFGFLFAAGDEIKSISFKNAGPLTTNGSSFVDGQGIDYLMAANVDTPPPPQPAPEPASIGLLGIGLLLATSRRKSR